jgi:atypical dual specificity phosphatase
MPEYELYIGDILDASNHERIEKREIDSVLKLTYETPDDGYPNSVEVHEFSLTDGPQNDYERFKKAVEKLLELFDGGDTVFVHCSAGKSRSPTVSAAAIALHEDVEFRSAIETIRESRDINPHPILLKRGKDVVEELR